MNYLSSLWYSCYKDFNRKEKLTFFIDEKEHSVNTKDLDPTTSLNKYIRDVVHLTGTKNMCLQGGCGACIVAVSFKDPITEKRVLQAVNSCLVPLYSCAGWNIITIETIGNSQEGYHPTQKALVQFNGTQCGYCSSGMIMNMYALYESSNPTMQDVEDSFGGNICRCTGYRPILTAFKSLASDASQELLGSYCDIEDIPTCDKNKGCKNVCQNIITETHYYVTKKARWYKAFTINETLDIINEWKNYNYRLVAGNTASGLYKPVNIDVYINISDIKNLLEHSVNKNELIVGANMTLANTIMLFNNVSKKYNFSYLKLLADHMLSVAHVPVRNIATLAGNLFTKHQHHEFQSDIFLLLESVGATLTIVGINRKEETKSLTDFLNMDMNGKLIKSIKIPSYDSHYKFASYKIMPRAQNALAVINAAFMVRLNNLNKVTSARIVYGAVNPDFVHAYQTENYLLQKKLFENDTLQNAFKLLEEEIRPDNVPPNPSTEFRKHLTISLFYKFVLSITPKRKLSPRNISGGSKLKRPLSSGTQDFDTKKSLYPLTQPIPKVEALAQCDGTAEYIMDKPDRPDQLYAALVLAKAPPYSVITKTDASKALSLEGTIAYYDKSNIPGENNFTPREGGIIYLLNEELFCSGEVKFYYQPVGMVVATSQEIAEEAADMVEISYSKSNKKAMTTIEELLANGAYEKIKKFKQHEPTNKGTNIKHVIKGKFNVYFQYHYHLETQCCSVVPIEDGLYVYSATQDVLLIEGSVAKVLNVPVNRINVVVRRLGGSYGAKISRSGIPACAASLAAFKLKRPVKLSMSLASNMNVMGKRSPMYANYEVGVDDKGVIQYLDASMYCDLGSTGGNDNAITFMLDALLNTYRNDTWNIKSYATYTDTTNGTWARAPGSFEGIAFLGNLIQHISTELNLDPIDVHIQNLNPKHIDLAKYLTDLVDWAEIKQRRLTIKEFNEKNRWVKKGMGVMAMVFPSIPFTDWNALISIHQGDGSISLTHGGIEMGQGINTKVAQVCAHCFGIPLNQVSVKPTNSLVSPNNPTTAASITSESVCYAIVKIAEILKERMRPVKDKMVNPTWKELVRKCYEEHVDLTATYMFKQEYPDVHTYFVYGTTCVEVELDVLTGQTMPSRVDIIEDVGTSLSPLVDIGQVEGAFVMGMGIWTSEEIIFDEEGRILTNSTWTYEPPTAQDIPVDFRIKFPKNNPNPLNILGCKALGEPPICLSIGLALAIKDAVAAARIESDKTAKKWYPIDGPCSIENTFLNSLNNYKQYTL